MKVSLSWLRELIAVPDDLQLLRDTLDDLGLVVEGVEQVGEGLADVVVARVDEIHAIEGADRVRRVIVDAGDGPLQIVCGAMNFEVGNHVPLAPVGATLPGDFFITERKMRGVVSNGMLCSGRELNLGDDHSGLLLLDGHDGVRPGQRLVELLGITPDVVFDISPEGNRPDAWSMLGVARDLAARFGGEVIDPHRAARVDDSSTTASAAIATPELCGVLHVGEITGVVVGPSPLWIQRRLEQAGMRAVNNVVDASNYVMLERGQPTHPYDAAHVSGEHLGVRAARRGETLRTLDGAERTLGMPGRGLGDSGVDCVIVDGDDAVIGLAGIMGGASSEISEATTKVLLEVAFFDPMTIARTSKKLGLRSEASHRFERGVHFHGATEALERFLWVLRESCPGAKLTGHHVAQGRLPMLPTITLHEGDVAGLLGTEIPLKESARLLRYLNFHVLENDGALSITIPSSRLDVRTGAAGQADVIEEIARLYSYRRLSRRTPTWPQPGGLTASQSLRRTLRDVAVGLGLSEAWTPSLVSDEDFALTHQSEDRVRVTNPLAAEESVLRRSQLVGLLRAWLRNAERGFSETALFEIGNVVTHPSNADAPRLVRGGVGGNTTLTLPVERELFTAFLPRLDDDATTAVATWSVLAERLGLSDVEVRTAVGTNGWHPTRTADLVDAVTQTVVGRVGELDPSLLEEVASQQFTARRVGLVQCDVGLLMDEALVRRRPLRTPVPTRFPAATFDLALVTPLGVPARTLRTALKEASTFVEDVTLFDVYRGAGLVEGARSLTFAVRLCADDRTLGEDEVLAARTAMLTAAEKLGALLR